MTHVSRTPALVSLHQTAFQFANGETIFNNLNLQFDHTPTAIVGRNGVGKSVLARLIAGRLQPTAGSVTCTAAAAYVAQTFIAEPGQTVADVTGTAAALRALENACTEARRRRKISTVSANAGTCPNACGNGWMTPDWWMLRLRI